MVGHGWNQGRGEGAGSGKMRHMITLRKMKGQREPCDNMEAHCLI